MSPVIHTTTTETMSRSNMPTPKISLNLSFVLVAIALGAAGVGAVPATNDWSKPCFDGECAYDLPARGDSALGAFKIVLVHILRTPTSFISISYLTHHFHRQVHRKPSRILHPQRDGLYSTVTHMPCRRKYVLCVNPTMRQTTNRVAMSLGIGAQSIRS